MQFGIIEADTFYRISDPLMGAGTFYSWIWLFLAIFLAITRYPTGKRPPAWALAATVLLAIYLVPRSAVLAFINFPLPGNVSLGMFGGPPIWPSLASVAAGALLGWQVRRRREEMARRSKAPGSRGRAGHSAGWARLRNVLLSFILPGLGQAYYGAPFRALGLFLGIAMMTGMAHAYGLIVVYAFIQADNLMRPSLIDRLFEKPAWGPQKKRPSSGAPAPPLSR
jgi:hypothetical protein